MQIVASADIGQFGPTDGKPVTCNFNPFYHIQGIIPWLFLPLAFVAFKENRTAQAAWILVPILLLEMIYPVVLKILQMTSGSTVQLNVMFTTIVVGFSLICLLSERIGNQNRFVTFLLATLIYFGFLGVNLLSNGFDESIISITFLIATTILSIIFASIMSALNLSKPFSKARFIIYPVAALFISQLIFLLATALLFFPSPIISIKSQLNEVLFFSFFSSLIYFLGLLPFLVLLFANPFWRKRFESLTGIHSNIPFEPPPTNKPDIPQNQI